MAYFLYKVFPDRKLEAVDQFEKYPPARDRARALRAELAGKVECTVRVIFAANPEEAERLLREVREPRPLGEDA